MDSESINLGSNPSPAVLRRYRFSEPSVLINKKDEDTDVERSETEVPIFMPYFIYILECADKSLYVGCTNNLERRLEQHNDSKWGAHYTKIRRPVVLKYSEKFATLKEARRKEIEIKGWRREKKINLINSANK